MAKVARPHRPQDGKPAARAALTSGKASPQSKRKAGSSKPAAKTIALQAVSPKHAAADLARSKAGPRKGGSAKQPPKLAVSADATKPKQHPVTVRDRKTPPVATKAKAKPAAQHRVAPKLAQKPANHGKSAPALAPQKTAVPGRTNVSNTVKSLIHRAALDVANGHQSHAAATAPPKSGVVTGKAAGKVNGKVTGKVMGKKPTPVQQPTTLPPNYRPSDKEPFMGALQRLYFRAKLLNWKDDIIMQNRETLLVLHEDTLQHADLADRATSETERALELRSRDRQRKLVSKIDSAIARIDDGSYGYCEVTGEPIALKRLDARPIATMSLEAQERHERREKVYRDE